MDTHRHVFAPRRLLIRQGWQKSRKSGLGLWRNLLEATPNECQSGERHPGLQLPPQALDNRTTSNGFPKMQPNQTTDSGSARVSNKKTVKVRSILSLWSVPNPSAEDIHQQSRAQRKGAWAQASSTPPCSSRCLRQRLWRLTAPNVLFPRETFCTDPTQLQPTFPHPQQLAGQTACLQWQFLEPGVRVPPDKADEAAEGQHRLTASPSISSTTRPHHHGHWQRGALQISCRYTVFLPLAAKELSLCSN